MTECFKYIPLCARRDKRSEPEAGALLAVGKNQISALVFWNPPKKKNDP